MPHKQTETGTRPPLHRDEAQSDRPVPRRTWRHARYGDAPDPATPGVTQDQTFSEQDHAEATGDAAPERDKRRPS